MLKSIAHSVAAAAVILAVSTPGSAADITRPTASADYRAGFAGATLRLNLDGPTAGVPRAGIGLGVSRYHRDSSGALISLGVPRPAIEAGWSNGRLRTFIGGEPLSDVERRVGISGSTNTLLLLGGLAVGAVVVVLLLKGDDEPDNPCPPGVEVCAF